MSTLAPGMIQVNQPTRKKRDAGGGGGGEEPDPEAIEKKRKFMATVVLRSLHGLFQSE